MESGVQSQLFARLSFFCYREAFGNFDVVILRVLEAHVQIPEVQRSYDNWLIFDFLSLEVRPRNTTVKVNLVEHIGELLFGTAKGHCLRLRHLRPQAQVRAVSHALDERGLAHLRWLD